MRKTAENFFVIFIILFAVRFIFKDDIMGMIPKDFGNKLEHGKAVLYYKNVTQEDAQKLLDYLIDQEIFDYDQRYRGQLTKESSVYHFKFLAKEDALSKDNIDDAMSQVAFHMSISVFDDRPVEVHLTNEVL